MSKPVLAVALLVVMAGAWQVALRPAGAPSPSSTRVPAPVGSPLAGSVPLVRLGQLGAHVGSPAAPGASRNPFALGETALATRVAPDAAPDIARPSARVEPPAAPAWPRVALVGVAEAGEGEHVVRTAVVSGPHGVHHVQPGDVFEQVYRVERVGASAVDLELLPERRSLRLTLRP